MHAHGVILRMHSASKWTEHDTAVWQNLPGAEDLIHSQAFWLHKCFEHQLHSLFFLRAMIARFAFLYY